MHHLVHSCPESGKTAHFRAGLRLLLIALLAVAGLTLPASQASAQAWSLTKAQRQAYLNYYAPVLLKRGDESSTKKGRDWLANFDFDRDGNFSNNRVNWLNINQYVNAAATGTGQYSNWRIRPTMYTALIEYMDGGSKSLVLLYHVYNPADKNGQEIHDWERIEIIIRGITGTPGGSGEVVSSVTDTHHHDHIMRRSYDTGLNFMQTATGKHVLIWQADQSDNSGLTDLCDTYGHELRFVKNTYSWIAGRAATPSNTAEVNVSGKDKAKNVSYVFVPEASSAAVSAWGAQPLSYGTASTLASGLNGGLRWSQVKRLTYELQDIADILPTHWQSGTWYTHWLADEWEDILLESPIVNEAGQAEVTAGLQRFYTKSRDSGASNLTDGREGYPEKSWLYGAYSAELDEDCPSGGDDFKAYQGSGTDSYGLTRGAASGYYNSHGSYWWQHDFFVHSGAIEDADTREAGKWLTGAWYTAANGGFDGRWVQLFDDRPNYEAIAPLTLSITYPYDQCTSTFWITASARGGQAPYTFTWTNAYPYSAPSDPNNSAYVDAYTSATVSVRSADGQTRSSNLYFTPYCPGGELIY